jgi:hypothetical protein
MILEPRNHTSGSPDLTYTNSTEKASPRIVKQSLNHQTTSPPYLGPNHQTPAKTNSPHQPTHLLLTKISAGLPHHQTKTPTPEPDIDDLCHQTHIALASLIFARNNNRPQQIWHLRLLQLQQQRLLSDPTLRLRPWSPNPPITLDPNESLVIYTTPCADNLQPLAGLEDLADLEDLEDPEEDQERLKDPLQQYLRQPQPPTQTIGLWETYPQYSTEIELKHEPSSTRSSLTSEPIHEFRASIHPSAKYPSLSPSSKDPK